MKVPEKIVCDICGKEIKSNIDRFKIKYERKEKGLYYTNTIMNTIKGRVDVCGDCYYELTSLIEEKMNKDD